MHKIRTSKQLKLLILAFLVLLNCTMLNVFLFVTHQNAAADPVQVQYPELSQINGSHASFPDLSDYFTKLAKTKGAAYAYEVLKRAQLSAGVDYHLLAHAIGDILYKQQGAEGIKICTNDFRNACSHSIVIALFQEEGLGAINTIAKICKDAPGGKGAYTMCFHGLGHGVLAYTDYHMETAIKLCEKVGTKAYQQQEYIECVGGVTMEMANGVHDVTQWKKMYPTYFSIDDPLSPCNKDFIPSIVRPQCYVYITPKLFEAAGAIDDFPTPEQFDTAFTYCDRIPHTDPASRDSCYAGFGKEFIVLAQGGDIRQMEVLTTDQLHLVSDWCALADHFDSIRSCLIQAENSLYWGGENSWETAVGLCRVVSEDQKKDCYNNLMSGISYYSTDKKDKELFCKALPKQFQNDCMKKVLAYAE